MEQRAAPAVPTQLAAADGDGGRRPRRSTSPVASLAPATSPVASLAWVGGAAVDGGHRHVRSSRFCRAHPLRHRDPQPLATAGATISGVHKTVVIGYSRQHRPIVAYEMGNPTAPFKTVVLGSMHGYWERAGEQVVASIRKRPVSSAIDLWVIPTINPDGDALHQRGNQAGVDLNRNFPVGWTYIAPTSSKFDSHYSGPRALSEPESLAMYKFLGKIRPNRMVSMHQPLDAVDATDGGARDIRFRNALSANLGLNVSPLTCWSQCHGSMTRWLTATQKGAAITVEFPQSVSAAYLSSRAAPGVLAALALGVKAPVRARMTGHLDSIRATPGTVVLAGWVLDPQRPSASGSVSVAIDGRAVRTVVARTSRPDVNKAKGATGGHGFAFSVRANPGNRRVCVTARAAGTNSTAQLLGACRVVKVPVFTFTGKVDHLITKPKAVRVVGWAWDPLHPTGASWIRIYVDGREVTHLRTSIVRADINAAKKTSGHHGFDVTLPVAAGRHTLKVITLQAGTSSKSVVLPIPAGGVVTVPSR